MLKQEWLQLKKEKKLLLSIVVMFIMPLLYAGMLLWAFWDPYGHLEKLPVALVNEDAGIVYEGEHLQLGQDLVTNLEEEGTFKFIETSSEQAERMLQNSEAYIVIQIPRDFSQHATTLLDENPQKLAIEYKVNEASNFLSSKIGDSAINSIRTEVNEQVSKTYAEQLFDAITNLSDGFGEAAVGATEIKDGVVQLKDGTIDLQTYLEQLASSTVTLADGTNELADGVVKAENGAQQLVDGTVELTKNSAPLQQGLNDLSAGASSLQQGVTNYTAGVEQLASGQQQLADGQKAVLASIGKLETGTEQVATGSGEVAGGTEQVAAGVEQLAQSLQGVLAMLPEEQQQALQASLTELQGASRQVAVGAKEVAAGASSLTQGMNELQQGQSKIVASSEKVSQGLQQLVTNRTALESGTEKVASGASAISANFKAYSDGVSTIASGVQSLQTGLNALNTGANELENGTITLSEKSGELADGSGKLVDGTSKLEEGTEQLSQSLQDAQKDSQISSSDKNYEMVSSPVEVDKDVRNSIENYGTGLAPYFIALGLFVGALLITNVYPILEPAVRPTGVLAWYWSKTAVLVVIWFFQTAILGLFLLYGLKLEVSSVPLFILLMAVTSFTFIAIVQLLTAVLGDPGRFLALVLLILQLASSAGTFPVELLPEFLQVFNQFLPMSFAVEALRHVISATDYEVVWKNIGILASIGVTCVVCTILFLGLLYKKKYRPLSE